MARKSKKASPPAPLLVALVRQFLKDSGFKSTLKIFEVESVSSGTEPGELKNGAPDLMAIFEEWVAKEKVEGGGDSGSDSSSEADDEQSSSDESSDDSDDDDDEGDGNGGKGKEQGGEVEESSSSDTVIGDREKNSETSNNDSETSGSDSDSSGCSTGSNSSDGEKENKKYELHSTPFD